MSVLPLTVFTLILTLPFFLPVTLPLPSTVAMDVSVELHVTEGSVPFGSTSAVSCSVWPTLIVLSFSIDTFFGWSMTLNLSLSFLPSRVVLTSISKSPSPTAVTQPLPVTVARLVLEDFHSRFVTALPGDSVARSCTPSPFLMTRLSPSQV